MDISPTTATPAAANRANTDTATETGTMIASDFDTFLTMLTTQMENQDPLNPIESTDFAVQLATFSGVEQQVQTNDLLAAIQSQLGARGMSEYASWVGMEVQTVGATAFDGSPITLHPEPAGNAEAAVVVVRHAGTGSEVDRLFIPVSNDPVEWAGTDDNGNPFPSGNYTFHLQSIEGDGNFTEEQIAVFSEVQELRMVNGETRLILAGGGNIAATDVDAVRRPEPPEA